MITDEEILKWVAEEKLLLLCEEDDVLRIVKTALTKFGKDALTPLYIDEDDAREIVLSVQWGITPAHSPEDFGYRNWVDFIKEDPAYYLDGNIKYIDGEFYKVGIF